MIFNFHPLGRAGVFTYHYSTLGIKKTFRIHVKIIFLKSRDINLRFHGHYGRTDLHFKCTELAETVTETKHSEDMRPQHLYQPKTEHW